MNEKTMNKSEENIEQEVIDIEQGINDAISLLAKYNVDVKDYLLNIVATLCNVSKEGMFANSDIACCVHARWLYWYAYRYMTNESFAKIASESSSYGHPFVLRTVQSGTSKMSMMIEQEPVWKKRWIVLKKIIKLRNQDVNNGDNVIVINIPRELKEHIKIEIKEK